MGSGCRHYYGAGGRIGRYGCEDGYNLKDPLIKRKTWSKERVASGQFQHEVCESVLEGLKLCLKLESGLGLG